MSIKKNVHTINRVYDLVKAGSLTYDNSNDPPAILYTWGANSDGQLGQDNRVARSSFVQIPGTNWSATAKHLGGERARGVIKCDGSLWVWGMNQSGLLGLGVSQYSFAGRSSPVEVGGTTWCSINFSGNKAYAMKTDNTFWVWGNGASAFSMSLGLGSPCRDICSPTQLPGTDYCYGRGLGSGASGWLKTNGTLYTAGYSQFGQLGYGTRGTAAVSPTQVPGTTWSTLSGSNGGTALKTDGSLWTWGLNYSGQLGINVSNPSLSSPNQVPGTWIYADNEASTVFAIKSNGTMWGWGESKIGNNTAVSGVSSPIQIPGTNWVCVHSSSGWRLAKKSDGTYWMWGDAANLPFSNGISYSSPIQLPGTNWYSPVGGCDGSGMIFQK